MKAVQLSIGAALVIVTATISTSVVSQEKKNDQPPAMTPEQMQMMQKWEEFMTPGPGHERIAFKVGKWEGVIKHWMDPKQEPEMMTGASEYTWIFDGRYLHNKTTGDFQGMPFHGQAWEGYDNLKKKYAWVWIDNMGTGFMNAEGTYDEKTKTFTYTYDHPDLMTGKYVKGRSVERIIDNDHFVGEMYGPGPDGKEFKMMEISYTRVK
jgi:hypothetical protein